MRIRILLQLSIERYYKLWIYFCFLFYETSAKVSTSVASVLCEALHNTRKIYELCSGERFRWLPWEKY